MARPSGVALLLARLLARLPLGWLRAGGALLGVLAWALSAAYRRKLRENLRRAGFPGAPMALASAAQAGRMVAELPWIWFRPPSQVFARVRCDELPLLEAVRATGRPILFLTPHLGAFEMTARWYAQRAPITVLYKPPRSRTLQQLLEPARAMPGLMTAPASAAGLRRLLQALVRGEAIGILPDQVPDEGEGVWAPFFGEAAWTMTLPHKLARRAATQVVLAVGERLSGGRGWQLHLERFDGEPTPEAVNAAMERLVRRFPTQYLWGYNRYKRQQS
jgi:KDO2-lipid IV(A) lauroyltransferase